MNPLERLAPELDTSWMAAGACRDADPALFFPPKGAPTRDAKEVCFGCPVRAACLDYALAAGEKFGIWGGTSERERRRLRRGPLRCAHCGEIFTRPPRSRDPHCSDRCRRLAEREYHREYQRTRTDRVTFARLNDGHGVYSKYVRGCRCTACRRASRDYRRDLRVRQASGDVG